MIGSHRVEGYAIVSADGMIADRDGKMPETLRNDADQRFLQTAMDRAAVIVHGRHSHEGGPRAGTRKRIIVTRQIAAIAPDRTYPNAVLWNPAGAALEQAMAALDIGDGIIAVIGGTEVFGLVSAALRRLPSDPRRQCPYCRTDGRCFRKSARTRRRRTCSRATACAPDRRATSMPPPRITLTTFERARQ